MRLAAKRAAGRRELGLGHPLNPATLRREVRALHADHVNLGGALPLPALDALSRRPLSMLARQLVRANAVLEAAR